MAAFMARASLCGTLLILSARSRDFGFLKLHRSARLSVLDGHHGQVSALVANLCRRIDDLAYRADCIDNRRACRGRHELSNWLDLARAVCVRRQRERVRPGRLDANTRGLPYLRDPF